MTSILGNDIFTLQIKLGKGDAGMDKNEILKMAQVENQDEMELQVKDKSMMWSYIVMVVMAAIFSFIRSEQGLPMMDLTATVSASVCAAMTYRFISSFKQMSLECIHAVIVLCIIVGQILHKFPYLIF